ncbi:helix-hairpin-helix domain-containing protein [Candidatus Poribacteria bacterium]|nr:helix-hairpin-helix domain-containing protein [Candidatus Poribacteria bacterium]
MSLFTHQENKIIIFLSLLLVVGIVILYLKKTYPIFYNFLSLDQFSSRTFILSKENKNKFSNKKDEKININTANFNELVSIPYIGPKIADKIIEIRNKKKFNNINELKEVPGIGDKKLIKLEKYFYFDTNTMK